MHMHTCSFCGRDSTRLSSIRRHESRCRANPSRNPLPRRIIERASIDEKIRHLQELDNLLYAARQQVQIYQIKRDKIRRQIKDVASRRMRTQMLLAQQRTGKISGPATVGGVGGCSDSDDGSQVSYSDLDMATVDLDLSSSDDERD